MVSACMGTETTHYAPSSMTPPYIWSIPGPGTAQKISGGTSTSNFVTIKWVGGSGPYTFNVSGNGYRQFIVNVIPATATITGFQGGPAQSVFCNVNLSNGVTAIYETNQNNITYDWTAVGGVILSGKNTSRVTVKWNVAGQGSISAKYLNLSTGCTDNGKLNVSIDAASIATISKTAGSVCFGSSNQVQYTTQNGMTNYNWNFAQAPLASIVNGTGTQQVTLSWAATSSYPNQIISVSYNNALNCPKSGTATVSSDFTLPKIVGWSKPCYDVSGTKYMTETPFPSYSWSITPLDGRNINSPSLTGSFIETTFTLANAQPQYIVRVDVSSGSCATNASFVVNPSNAAGCANGRKPVPTNEEFAVEEDPEFSVYPIPANEKITVTFPSWAETGATFLLTDGISSVLYSGNKNENEKTREIETNQISNGLYFLRINSGNQSITKKILVRH